MKYNIGPKLATILMLIILTTVGGFFGYERVDLIIIGENTPFISIATNTTSS